MTGDLTKITGDFGAHLVPTDAFLRAEDFIVLQNTCLGDSAKAIT